MTTTSARSAPTVAPVNDHSTLECELIRRTDALLSAVAAQEAHEPTLDDIVTFLHQEVLPHMEAEALLLHAPSPDSPTALLARALTAQHGRLADLAAEVAAARTGIDAVRAASAVVALFMAVAEAEDALLLPALPPDGTGPDAHDAALPGATTVPTARRQISLDLCGRDYETCRRELSAAVHSLWPGDTLSITSGPELLALRFELETHLPAGYRWSLPAGTAECSVTTVERL